jgi:hypothetical protein
VILVAFLDFTQRLGSWTLWPGKVIPRADQRGQRKPVRASILEVD